MQPSACRWHLVYSIITSYGPPVGILCVWVFLCYAGPIMSINPLSVIHSEAIHTATLATQSHSEPVLGPRRKRPSPPPSPAGRPPSDPALAARKLPNLRGSRLQFAPPSVQPTVDPTAKPPQVALPPLLPRLPPPSVVPRKEPKPLPLRGLKEPLGIVGGIRKEQGGLRPFQAFHSPHQGQAHRTIVPVGRGRGEGQDFPRIQVQE